MSLLYYYMPYLPGTILLIPSIAGLRKIGCTFSKPM